MTNSWLPKAVVAVVALVGVTGSAARAAETNLQAFVGTWKENQAKSHHVMSGALTYTFTEEPDGLVSIVRANTPLHDRAGFDGMDYPQPSMPGRSVSWTKVSDTQYDSTIKTNGVLLASARWTLLDGGTRLTQETIPVRANGDRDVGTIEYVRISGAGNTLFGVWKPVSSRYTVPDLFTITLVGDELHVFYPKYGYVVYTMRVDGKRYAPTAPNTVAGAGTMAESVAVRTVRRITYQGEKATLEIILDVSADANTMTVTTRTPGSSDEPSVTVYERQP
jgi:hypothetical protein